MLRPTDRTELFKLGLDRISEFEKLNKLPATEVFPHRKSEWDFSSTCAYYRRDQIHIVVDLCARPSGPIRSRNWNWPGSTTGREPFGVLAHELGHHADIHRSTHKARYSGNHSRIIRKASGEKPLTSYCPNDAEWFAEMFRLFITNHLLLREVRPRTYGVLIDHGWLPVSHNEWQEPDAWKYELGTNCPDHIITNLERRIRAQN